MFNFDISFFIFTGPVIKMIVLYVISIFVGLIIYTTIYYILVFNKYLDGVDKETLKTSRFIKKIIKYIKFIAICFSVYTIVKIPDIVTENFATTGSGLELVGAGFSDITIKIIGNAILAFLISISIFMGLSNYIKGKRAIAIKRILIVPIYMIFMIVVMLGFDLIFVNSNQYDKEKTYIERNISNTKNAYGIKYETETIKYSGTITEEEIEKNNSIINNVAIIDKNLVIDTLNEEQNEQGYYKYKTAGIYEVDGKIIYLSPKEISNAKRTYNSKTYEYTHGYGAISSSAVATTESGEIEYIQLDLENPRIYYGLQTDNIIVTNKNVAEEYDYIDNKGEEHSYSYNGNSGLNLSFIDRIVLGIKTGNPSIGFSKKVNNDSKILINRNIIQRAKKALSSSNIIYDDEPYMVIDKNGQLLWILDAYTISENYPYSKYTNIQNNGERKKINYIRNSIKVIINSYDGEMKFYLVDDTDPIAVTYRKIYPDLFEDKDKIIPEYISEKMVYPEFLYNIQSSVLEIYHTVKPEVLFRGDDSWSKVSYVTTQNNKTINSTLGAYYTVIKQNDEEKIGLIQMYTPSGKQNIISYLIGTVKNGVNTLKMFRLSSNENILGLTQLDNIISQDEGISNEIEKLNITGAKVTKKMMVLPINNTLLYIEQIYQTKTNESNIPKLKKVIIASGNKVAIGNSLAEAVENMLLRYVTNIDTNTTEDLDGLIQSIIKANKNLRQSMDSKDLELIGSDVKKLQELITLLEKEKEKEDEKEKNDETIKIEENTIENTIVDSLNNTIENSIE